MRRVDRQRLSAVFVGLAVAVFLTAGCAQNFANLARYYQSDGEFERAIAYYERAVAAAPNSPALRIELARVHGLRPLLRCGRPARPRNRALARTPGRAQARKVRLFLPAQSDTRLQAGGVGRLDARWLRCSAGSNGSVSGAWRVDKAVNEET